LLSFQVAVAAAVAGGEATLKYTGVLQCLRLITKEEGVGALYRALPPRLISVVPMMGIQVVMSDVERVWMTGVQVTLDDGK